MKPEEQFDDLFSKRFNEGEFPFNEDHWEQAEQLIVAYEKKKRRRIFVLIFAALLISSSSVIYFMNSAGDVKQEVLYTPENKSSVKTVVELSDKIDAIVANKISKEKNNSTEFILSHEDIIDVQKEHSTKPSIVAKNKKELAAKINSQIHQVHSSSIVSNDVKAAFAEQVIPEIINQPENNQSIESDNADVAIINLANDSTTENLSAINNSNPAASPVAPIPPVIANKKVTVVSISGGVIAFKNFEGNTAASSGFNFNPFAGITYTHFINQHWSGNIGIAYFQRSKVNSKKEFTSVYYNNEFGVREENIMIENTKLQCISIPLNVGYHFNKSQSLFVGIQLCYLLNTTSDVVNTSSNGSSSASATSTKVNGYVNGFEKADFVLMAGYEQGIFKNIHALIHVQYGLKDVTKNSYFNNDSNDKNVGIFIGFKYDLISK